MMDVVDKPTRSRMMSGIRSKNTKPELVIRTGLHRIGYRFRLQDKSLPGKPDIVLKGRNAVIFVHGCFWHGHNCHLFKWPKTRPEWWRAKIEGNRERDKHVTRSIEDLGLRHAVVWECVLKGKHKLDSDAVVATISRWLESDQNKIEIRARKHD